MKPNGKTLLAIVVAGLLIFPVGAYAQDTADNEAKALMERAEELMRSSRAYSEVTMEVITPDWRRKLTLRNWDDREGKRTFIHILSPARDKDTTFLRLDYKLWSYLPRAERTIKIPPSMMLQSWMGSDFTNDDLVRESSYVNDYTHVHGGQEEVNGLICHKIILTPKPDAPVTWGKVEVWLSEEPFVPVRYRFYNRRGELRRTMIMSDIKEMDGRMIPVLWTMQTVDKPGHSTVLHLDTIKFNPDFPKRIFTQQYLQNPR